MGQGILSKRVSTLSRVFIVLSSKMNSYSVKSEVLEIPYIFVSIKISFVTIKKDEMI